MKNRKTIITVILPTYNEVDNIVPLIKEIQQKISSDFFEIIVVDDDSPDGTYIILKQTFDKDKKIKLFLRKKDKGLAKAIRFGIEKSSGDYIAVMDTDFNHDPDDLAKMLHFKEDFDIIVGSRYIKGGGMEDKLRYFLSFFYNLAIRFMLRLPTYDNLSGFFLMKKKSLERFNYDSIFYGYGDYFIRLLHQAYKNNLKIIEIPVFYKNRFAGKSKSLFLSMFIEYSKSVIEILTRK